MDFAKFPFDFDQTCLNFESNMKCKSEKLGPIQNLQASVCATWLQVTLFYFFNYNKAIDKTNETISISLTQLHIRLNANTVSTSAYSKRLTNKT